jgi:hypothetical protein
MILVQCHGEITTRDLERIAGADDLARRQRSAEQEVPPDDASQMPMCVTVHPGMDVNVKAASLADVPELAAAKDPVCRA